MWQKSQSNEDSVFVMVIVMSPRHRSAEFTLSAVYRNILVLLAYSFASMEPQSHAQRLETSKVPRARACALCVLHAADMVENPCQRAPSLSHAFCAISECPTLMWSLRAVLCLYAVQVPGVVVPSVMNVSLGEPVISGTQVFLGVQVLVSSGTRICAYVSLFMQFLTSEISPITPPGSTRGQVVP